MGGKLGELDLYSTADIYSGVDGGVHLPCAALESMSCLNGQARIGMGVLETSIGFSSTVNDALCHSIE